MTTQWKTKRIKSKKPIWEDDGITYKDALQWLVRVIPQDDPSFEFILGLASYATYGKLTEKQKEKATEIVLFYHKKGVV